MGGQRPVGDTTTLRGSHCPPGEARNKGKTKIIFSLRIPFFIYIKQLILILKKIQEIFILEIENRLILFFVIEID